MEGHRGAYCREGHVRYGGPSERVRAKDSIEKTMESDLRQKINGPVNNSMRMQIEESLVGKFVVTVYNGRKYRIDGIDWETTAGSPMPPYPRQIKKKEQFEGRSNY